jgi:molybdopterin-guanine dinucleotide biosynthesis protein MobB
MPAGKDGDRHLVAGSCSTAVVAPDKVVLTIPATSPTPVEEVMRLMGNDYDILLCEGYKYSSLPKIESHINPAQPLLRGIEGIAAVATTEKLDTPLKQFNFEDTNAITDFIEERFLNKHADDISVYVNGTNIPLIQFPKSIIPNVLLAMVGSLKGVDDIRHLQINLKRSEIQS